MQKELKTEVLIVGAGPAGLAAAIYTARANRKTLVLKGKAKPALAMAHKVENYPGFESISGQELLDAFEAQARRFGAEIIVSDVIEYGLGFDPKMVTTRAEIITADVVIIATGRGSHKTQIENEDRFIGLGVSYCAVCDGAFYRNKKVVVYGNDLEAIEDALMLKQLGCEVTLISHCKKVKCPEKLRETAAAKGIEMLPDTRIKSIQGDSSVERIVIENSEGGAILETNAVFIIQHVPSTKLLQRAGLNLNQRDCIIVNREQETNLPGVYAAGDVTCGGMQIATATGEGVMAALQALKRLRANQRAAEEAARGG